MTYGYDADFQGALSSVSYAGNSTSFNHDALGRVTSNTQTTGGQPYTFGNYSYTLTDQLTSMMYPSGRVVNYTLNSADQATAVQGTFNGVQTPYGSSITYSPGGDLASITFGNNVMESRSFNDQFETIQIQAGSLLSWITIIAMIAVVL